jgi:hypothetical protein
MERTFPDDFPFSARRNADDAAEVTQVTRLETPPPTPALPPGVEVIDVLTEADVVDGDVVDVPVAEEVFDVAEEAAAPRAVEVEPSLASPGLSAAARKLVTPVIAPLGVVSAVPTIVEAAVPASAVDAAEPAFVPTCAARADRGPERRKTPRQALRAKASFRGEADVTAQRTVRIVNLSLKGVRFWSGQQMSSGDRGDVRMEAGPVKWASRVRVVSCVTQGEGYEVGCEFVANELGPRRANLVNPLVWAPTQGEPKAAEAKAA